MSQWLIFKPGSIRALDRILERNAPATIFLVTGKDSYTECGAEAKIGQVLKGRTWVRFQEFRTNPQLADVEAGLKFWRQSKAALILAVGGGSVLDMAKLIGILATQEAAPGDIVQGCQKINKKTSIVECT